jgi:formate-dependent nitrite reductase cytochrome c552 subunit
MQRVERLQRDIADLQRQLGLAKDLLAKQKTDLDAQRKEFEEAVARERDLHARADFAQAVQTYEQLKPKQVKEMFQALMKDGKTRDVIDYLAAMQGRKAAAVLKEFKMPDEIPQATDLVQKLRDRGVDLLGKPELAKGTT